ncbi:MAG: deoxyuridine 5'-triphosphate nucleotidohydrolase [Phycisphaeraceae bacterium]|nr:MAG: deoxyuridine 5'-triphosphate nucleotidohydrolase [Phycisphaeraceae bacterium]
MTTRSAGAEGAVESKHVTTPAPAARAPVELRIRRLDARATTPKYHSELAAGLDLAACLPRGDIAAGSVTIEPAEIVKVPLGFAVAIPPGYEGQVRPRSGLSTKHGVTVPNAPGTVDADYRGEMFVALINLGPAAHTINHGDRIAQLVIAPVSHATIIEVDELEETGRGVGGFGSTGA